MRTLPDLSKLWLKLQRRFIQYSILAIEQPKWIFMFAFSRILIIRYFVLLLSKRSPVISYETENSIFEDIDPDRVVAALKNDGFYPGIVIPQYLLPEILDFARRTTYLGNGDPQFRFSLANKAAQELKYGRNFRIGYNFEPASDCAAIKKLETDPKLWEIATKYFGSKPILACTQMWWTFITDAKLEGRAQGFYSFHYDLEDYGCLKFMFYLTDVDILGGPHVCVKGSHKKKKLSHQFSLLRETSDREIREHYGDENVVTIYERAGFGFAEDPFCFHKGILPIQSDRLIVELKFTLNDYGRIL